VWRKLKCSAYMKRTNTAERLVTSCRIMLLYVLICGNDKESDNFLIWAVMNDLLSRRQRSCLRDVKFHFSNCEVYCGFACDTA